MGDFFFSLLFTGKLRLYLFKAIIESCFLILVIMFVALVIGYWFFFSDWNWGDAALVCWP